MGAIDDYARDREKMQARCINRARKALLPKPLLRQEEFKNSVHTLVGWFYTAPWLYFGFASLYQLRGEPPPLWSATWRAALAILFLWYHNHSYQLERGLWYPLAVWDRWLQFQIQCWRKANPEADHKLKITEAPLSYLFPYVLPEEAGFYRGNKISTNAVKGDPLVRSDLQEEYERMKQQASNNGTGKTRP